MTEWHIDTLLPLALDAFAHAEEVDLEAAEHSAVDGYLDAAYLVRQADKAEVAHLVAYAQHIVNLHILEARAEPQTRRLAHLHLGLLYLGPQQPLRRHPAGVGSYVGEVFRKRVGPFGAYGNPVDTALAVPAFRGHRPGGRVVILLAVGQQREGLVPLGLGHRVVHTIVEQRMVEPRLGRLT